MDELFKLWALLNKTHRRKAIALFFLMLIGMVLEALGIGVIIPVIGAIANPDLLQKYPIITTLIPGIEKLSHLELVTYALFTILVAYLVKAAFLVLLAWKQTNFAFELQKNFSYRLFVTYIHKPWVFHLDKNSAQLIRNTTGDISTMVANFVIPSMSLLVELMVLIGVVSLLIFVEPGGTILIFLVLAAATLSLNYITRMPLLRWGKELLITEKDRIQNLQQALGGIKEVKLLGCESHFIGLYDQCNSRTATLLRNQTFLQLIPKLWLEIIGIFGLVGLSLFVLNQGKSTADLLPILGMFAVASFRLLPSTTRIISSLQYIRHSEPLVQKLYHELHHQDAHSLTQTSAPANLVGPIELKNLSFTYPGSNKKSVNNTNLSIPFGSLVGIIGYSGSGKSTLVDLILGLLTPEAGAVIVDSVNIQENLRGWQKQIGYVAQHIYLTDDTLRRNVAFGIADELIDDQTVLKSLELAQLKEFVNTLEGGLEAIVGERGVKLSGGQRQRIGIARSLYHNPKVLVLDEATSALDIDTEKEIMKDVSALAGKKTVIIISHNISELSRCDILVKLGDNKEANDSAE